MSISRSAAFVSLVGVLLAAAGCKGANKAAAASAAPAAPQDQASAPQPGGPAAQAGMARGIAQRPAVNVRVPHMDFQPYTVLDRKHGGMRVGTIAMPAGWSGESRVDWNYSNVSFPVRIAVRLMAPDGSAWLECFPSELFYWLEPPDTSTRVGAMSLGMIHRPRIGAIEAMQQYVIGRYRGRAQGLKIVGFRPIGNLAQALGKPAMAGDSIAARVHYTVNGRSVDEELFLLLTSVQRIPYHGPQGTTFEDHRFMVYAFSMGAADGKLDAVKPVLGFVVTSWRSDPIWERFNQQVLQQLSARFNQNIAAGYQRIAAAGALSRQISANNDAMIQGIEAQRQASNQTLARMNGGSSMNDSFDQYIRGTERMQDPYWGTSEQSYTNQYHWTDGYGNYQHSNDATFNPNIGSNQNWQLMQRAPK